VSDMMKVGAGGCKGEVSAGRVGVIVRVLVRLRRARVLTVESSVRSAGASTSALATSTSVDS